MQDIPPPPVITQEVRIVDAQGKPRILLSAAAGAPSITLIGSDAKPAATVKLDQDNHPSVTLANPDPAAPVAALEIDAKGAHVKFDRPGGASSYLFLNNAGGSGVVLIDRNGVRRVSIVLGADGTIKAEGLEANAAQGKANR